MPTQEKTIWDLFEDNELKISVLYKIYSQKIPGHKKFWASLSEEEVAHAKDISLRRKKSTEGALVENKFSRGVVNFVIDFVENQIQFAKNNPISHKQALGIALKVEQSILEKKCFEMFTPTDLTVINLFNNLNVQTDKHVRLLEKELKNQK